MATSGWSNKHQQPLVVDLLGSGITGQALSLRWQTSNIFFSSTGNKQKFKHHLFVLFLNNQN